MYSTSVNPTRNRWTPISWLMRSVMKSNIWRRRPSWSRTCSNWCDDYKLYLACTDKKFRVVIFRFSRSTSGLTSKYWCQIGNTPCQLLWWSDWSRPITSQKCNKPLTQKGLHTKSLFLTWLKKSFSFGSRLFFHGWTERKSFTGWSKKNPVQPRTKNTQGRMEAWLGLHTIIIPP